MKFTFILIQIIITVGYSFAQPVSDYFKLRRDRVISKLGDGVLIISAAKDQDANRNEYRQDNYFWYLTGYPEPDAIAVLNFASKSKYALFVREPFFIGEIYGGVQPSFRDIKEEYHADTVIFMNEFPDYLKRIASMNLRLFVVNDGLDINFSRKGEQIVGNLKTLDAKPFIDELRLVKDALEIENTRRADKVTCQALCDAYKACRPNMYEYEVEALIEYNFRKEGLSMPAYRSIVGSGARATILHYDSNNNQMKDGELLLMDVGAESGMYAADITRTIPVNGKFSEEQKTIYELVLKAEEAAIKLMKPGIGNLECNHRAIEVFTDGLVKLGLITDPNAVWQKKLYVLYRVNHWMGLDVHDVGSFGPSTSDFRMYMFNPNEKGRPFEPGMISAIEPGLYFRPDLLDKIRQFAGNDVPQREIDAFLAKVKPVYQKYMNIGVRIEDDVLITETGNEVLSAAIPKTVSAIEALMKK